MHLNSMVNSCKNYNFMCYESPSTYKFLMSKVSSIQYRILVGKIQLQINRIFSTTKKVIEDWGESGRKQNLAREILLIMLRCLYSNWKFSLLSISLPMELTPTSYLYCKGKIEGFTSWGFKSWLSRSECKVSSSSIICVSSTQNCYWYFSNTVGNSFRNCWFHRYNWMIIYLMPWTIRN